MTHSLVPKLASLAAIATVGCQSGPTPAPASGWDEVKRAQVPVCALKDRYDAPFRQPMASLAWEDGVYVSRDGLALYSDYVQCDLFSFFLSKPDMREVWRYQRGPSLGQDLANPLNTGRPWIHGDIVVSTRSGPDKPFGPWRLSKLSGKYGNLGGVVTIGSPGKPGRYDYVAYTGDLKSGVKIKLLRNTGQELAGDDQGEMLPGNINDRYHADNPHIERPDPAKPNHLVLLFDSDDRPGLGQHDIFYSVSDDAGKTWSGPFPVASVNSKADEEQPHLFEDHGTWWLYLTSTNFQDGKLGIFRYRQARKDDWNDWVDRELVVGAGTAAAVGEPTLTADGDLSFVAISINTAHGTATDRYDCDPWFMKRKR
ncbi:MAG: hypothetical protein P4L46_24810 [Fimbriimonas sp.]|nr:hypothetical protein [Fimbriimonas sp.]